MAQKKMYLEQVKNSEVQLETINKQILTIERTMIDSEIMKAMKLINSILTKL